MTVSLQLEPGFLVRNQLLSQARSWITIPGIAHLDPTELERMLCPVCQLRLYLCDMEAIRGAEIVCSYIVRDITRTHIIKWIVETVKEAYILAKRDYGWVTAHKVRALATSWTYSSQVVLPDILSVTFWQSSGVFQNSYLRDRSSLLRRRRSASIELATIDGSCSHVLMHSQPWLTAV